MKQALATLKAYFDKDAMQKYTKWLDSELESGDGNQKSGYQEMHKSYQNGYQVGT